jgi:ankyrin repeat protein
VGNAILEIVVFFDGIKLFLLPYEHQSVFNKGFVSQIDFETIYPLVAPKILENEEIEVVFRSSYAFDKASLQAYLSDLKNVIKESQQVLPMLINSSSHTVCLWYDKLTEKWAYVDTNDFARYPDNGSYTRELNDDELASSLLESFSSNSYTAFSIEIIEKKRNENRNIRNKLQQISPSPAEQAVRYDSHNAGLFYIACGNGDLGIVKELLKCSKGNSRSPLVDINHPLNGDFFTPLLVACQNGHIDVVKILLEHGVDINKASITQDTPLTMACDCGRQDITRLLLEHIPVLSNKEGQRLFEIVCRKGYPDLLRELLDNSKVNSDMIDSNQLLLTACKNGHVHILNELLTNSKVRIKDINKNQLLLVACENGHVDILKELLNNQQANVDLVYANQLVRAACKQGHLNVLNYILTNLPLNIPNLDVKELLFIACSNGCASIVKEILINPKFDIEKMEGNKLLDEACHKGHLDVVKELLTNPKINIYRDPDEEDTSLYIACEQKHARIVKELLKNSEVKVNNTNGLGQSLLYIACSAWSDSNIESVEALLNNKVHPIDIDQPNIVDETPLMVACSKQSMNIVKQLLEHNADILCKRGDGKTALDLAVLHYNEGIIDALLMDVLKRKLSINHTLAEEGTLSKIEKKVSIMNSCSYRETMNNSRSSREIDELGHRGDLAPFQ